MTPCQLIRHTAARFRSAGIPDPENDSALLLASLCGGEPLSLRLDTDTILEEPLLSRYELLTRQRLERIPLQYILGEAPFCGHLFMVDPRVLIPRPETELLCAWALDILKNYRDPRVLDLCCGSGCIGLSLKAASPEIRVTLSDISANALADAAAEVHADECSEATAVRPDAERQEEALSMDDGNAEHNADMADAPEDAGEPTRKPRLDLGSAQLAFIVTLTAGSLLKGVLDIYGTTNRLLIAYPVAALLILAFMAAAALKQSGKLPQIKGKETIIESAE